jgi:hypothetical protein
MNKGFVLEVKDTYILVVTDDCQYLKLKKRKGIKQGRQIYFTKEDLYEQQRFPVKNIGLAAAIVVLCMISITLIYKFQIFNMKEAFGTAVAVVSLDINPSFEFEIDDENRVVEVYRLNEDAKKLAGKNFIGDDIIDVVNSIIDSAWRMKYLTAESNSVVVSFAVIGDRDNHEQRIQELEKSIENGLQIHKDRDINFIYLRSDAGALEEARKNEVSLGKYELFKIISQKDSSVNIDEIKSSGVQNLIDKINEQDEGKSNGNSLSSDGDSPLNDSSIYRNDDIPKNNIDQGGRNEKFDSSKYGESTVKPENDEKDGDAKEDEKEIEEVDEVDEVDDKALGEENEETDEVSIEDENEEGERVDKEGIDDRADEEKGEKDVEPEIPEYDEEDNDNKSEDNDESDEDAIDEKDDMEDVNYEDGDYKYNSGEESSEESK